MFGKRSNAATVEYDDTDPRLPPALPSAAHKGMAGRVACLCGSAEMPGAALLAARAAQRAGAGLVSVGCLDERLLVLVPLAAPEAVLHDLVALAPTPELALDAWCERAAHARLVGPGLGASERTRALVDALLARAGPEPLVLDADALNALAGRVLELRARRAPTVLTPHPGEAQRLLGRAVPDDEAGRAEFARELAAKSGAVVVLKGAGTVVCDGERIWKCVDGNPGLATAGSGDVLAGILVAYAARARALERSDYDAYEAARAAVWIHALSGDEVVDARGERGLIASDLIDALPGVQQFNED